MNHVVLGMAFPFAAFFLVYALRRFRANVIMLIATPVALFVCGIWAIAPDIPRILRLHALYDRLARDPRTNAFFWHYAIDQTEGYSPWFNLMFAAMLVFLLYTAWRELVLREKGG